MLKTETPVLSRISRKFFSNNNNPVRGLSRSASSQTTTTQTSQSSLSSSLSSSDSSGSEESGINMKRRKSSPENGFSLVGNSTTTTTTTTNDSKIKMIEDFLGKKYDNVVERDQSYCLYFNNKYNKWTIEKKSLPVMVVTYDSKEEAAEAYKKFIMSSPEVK